MIQILIYINAHIARIIVLYNRISRTYSRIPTSPRSVVRRAHRAGDNTQTLTVRSRWSHYRATHSCIMHPTKLLFAGDCLLTRIRRCYHCTQHSCPPLHFFNGVVTFLQQHTKKKPERFGRILLALPSKCQLVGLSGDAGGGGLVNNALALNPNGISVNPCTRYFVSTRRKDTSAILNQSQQIFQVSMTTKDYL